MATCLELSKIELIKLRESLIRETLLDSLCMRDTGHYLTPDDKIKERDILMEKLLNMIIGM